MPKINYSVTDIPKLNDDAFVIDLLLPYLKKYYSGLEKITDINKALYKRHYKGPRRYSYVVGCQLTLIISGQKKIKEIFIGASGDQSKKIAFRNLKLLRKNGFDQGPLQVTPPIAYVPELRAIIYESAPGRPLYSYFQQQPNFQQLLKPLELSAAWLHKLHQLDSTVIRHSDLQKYEFNSILDNIARHIPKFTDLNPNQGLKLETVVKRLEKYHKQLSKSLEPRVIYGDFHPENIILTSLKAKRLIMIDLTDLSVGDPYRDVGTFVQQLDFMSQIFLSRKKINKLKKHFISSYTGEPFNNLNLEAIHRINLYQALTAARSATWLFYYRDALRASLELLNDSILLLDKIDDKKISINLR